MNIRRAFLLATTAGARADFVRDCKRPERAQARVWRRIWDHIGQSPHWRGRAHAARPWLSELPMSTYDDYRPALQRSFDSAHCELSGAPIRFWSVSAGSTGPRKLFPITDVYRSQFQRTTPPFLHAMARRHPRMLAAPVLYFAGAMPTEHSPAGIEVGFISNYNYRSIPAFLRRQYAFPVEVLRDADTFAQWGQVYALASDLSVIVGITPAIMVRFFERMVEHADTYLAALAGRADLPAGLPVPTISRERLAMLERVLGGPRVRFADLWPSLSAVVCWKAATCGLQLPALAEFTGDVPIVDATYSATEGWINVPRADGRVGGAVHPGAHAFEFLPADVEPRADNLVPLWELSPGRDYELVLTTAMGLVRYRLFDRVRCTGHFHRSPVIEFVRKASAEISLGPACVSESELAQILADSGVASALFAPAPTGDRLQLCHWHDDGDAIDIAALEHRLRALNPMYARYVTGAALKPLELRRLSPDHPAVPQLAHAQEKPRLLHQEPIT